MVTSTDCIDRIVAQYDSTAKVDHFFSCMAVDFSVTRFPDYIEVLCEGSHDKQDWWNNFKAWPSYQRDDSYIMYGFDEGTDQALEDAMKYFDKSAPMYLVGHSRGAAHAHVFAKKLIDVGFDARQLHRVVFGSPKPGDPLFASKLLQSPLLSRMNRRDMFHQDIICCEPMIGNFVHPGARSIILQEPKPDDPWGPAAYHRSEYYQQAEHAIGGINV